MLGLFDRPAESIRYPRIYKDLNSTVWQTIIAKLRRARLLAGEHPQNPEQLPEEENIYFPCLLYRKHEDTHRISSCGK
jgi:hypothetical protein